VTPGWGSGATAGTPSGGPDTSSGGS
jgi:hypothetical protein